jgi:SsrA-binding protein
MGQDSSKAAVKLICRNRRALHDYEISERFEAGLVLLGSEAKSLREGSASLSDAYAELRDGELFLVGCHIAEYPWANRFNHAPRRDRKLLMHRAEIRRLGVKLAERGYTLIPLQLYFKEGRAKVELGLARGKRQYDKRETARRRELDREAEAELSSRSHPRCDPF